MLLRTISEEYEVDDDSIFRSYDMVYNDIRLDTHTLKVGANMMMQRDPSMGEGCYYDGMMGIPNYPTQRHHSSSWGYEQV